MQIVPDLASSRRMQLVSFSLSLFVLPKNIDIIATRKHDSQTTFCPYKLFSCSMSSSSQISIRSPKNQPQRKTPPSFWDKLSRQVLVPRALKEFDRRTIKYHPPVPPQLPSLGSRKNYRDLKRFARLGGSSLADLRGVRFISHFVSIIV